MMKEYRVKVTVRNNLLLTAIEAAGYKTQTEFANAAGMLPSSVNDLIGMRKPPIGANGEFSLAAKQMMEALGACPSDLWTDEQLVMRLPKNTGQVNVNAAALRDILEHHHEQMTLPDPADLAESSETVRMVQSVVQNVLNDQEQAVIKGLYVDEQNLAEVAVAQDLSRERIRQIESKALRKLRLPKNSVRLGPLLDEWLDYCESATFKPAPSIHDTTVRAIFNEPPLPTMGDPQIDGDYFRMVFVRIKDGHVNETRWRLQPPTQNILTAIEKFNEQRPQQFAATLQCMSVRDGLAQAQQKQFA